MKVALLMFGNAFIISPICGSNRADFSPVNGVFRQLYLKSTIINSSWLMQLKKGGCFTAYIGKHLVQVRPQKERNLYMKENLVHRNV